MQAETALLDIDWSVPAPGAVASRFPAPSGDLALVRLGDPSRPRVVLVPGVTGSKEDFVLMSPLLVDAGFQVVAFDMAGQYESHAAGPRNGRRYDDDLFVDDLIAVLESDPRPTHVLGYSYAGTVVQLAWRRRPELFASLTLLSAPPVPGDAMAAISHFGWVSRVTPPALGAAFMISGLRLNYTKVPPLRQRFVLDRLRLTRRSSVVDIVGLMKRTPDVRAELAASALPLLVAVGEHDLWSTDLHRAAAEALGADLRVYPTGHSPCETTPDLLVRDMLALFERA